MCEDPRREGLAAPQHMDKADTDPPSVEVDSHSPTDIEICNETSRGLRVPSCFNSGLSSAVATLCIGLVSGAPGGLMLGATAVVVLQSLELLADKQLLMDQLEKYIMAYPVQNQSIWMRLIINQGCNIHISLFGLFSSALSLAGGIALGLSTYALVIRQRGEAAMGKALVSAAAVCLMAVTAAGCCLGTTLESFLSFTSSVSPQTWDFIIFFLVVCVSFVYFGIQSNHLGSLSQLAQVALVTAIVMIMLLKKIVLFLATCLFPATIVVILLGNTLNFKLMISPVPLMLIISDMFNLAGQPLVTLQPTAATNTSSAVVESIFLGVLTSQLWTAAVGMSLFVSWQTGGAAKILAGAVASGGAVLGGIKGALPVLGPGPTIAALMGVPGAVGVALAAGGGVTDRYREIVAPFEWIGKLGVTVGAAAGAFLSSCAHSGLSGVFMSLCAAGLNLNRLLFHLPPKLLTISLCLYLLIPVVLISFTYTGVAYICFMKFRIIFMYYLGIVCLSLFHVYFPTRGTRDLGT